MKLLKILFNCEGKLEMSTAQKVGLTAAVGVAGLAAGQMFLSGPSTNPDTVFSAKGEPEIVYVGGGSMAGNTVKEYTDTENTASTLYARRSGKKYSFNFGGGEIEEVQVPKPDLNQQEGSIEAYKMDGSFEGLSGGNRAVEKSQGGVEIAGVNVPGAAGSLQDRISQITADAQAKAAQAQGAAAGDPNLQQNLGAELSRESGKWDMVGGMARAGGNTFNSTPLQAGMPGSQRSGVLNGAAGVTTIPGAADIAAISPRFEGGRDSILASGQRYSRVDDSLEGYRKMSAEAAADRNRSIADTKAAFLNQTKRAGGIRLAGVNGFESLGGSPSNDYMNDPSHSISVSPLGNVGGEIAEEFDEFRDARDKLEASLSNFATEMNNLAGKEVNIFAVPIVMAINWTKAYKVYKNGIKKELEKFESKYGDEQEGVKEYVSELKSAAWKIATAAYWPGLPAKKYNEFQKGREEKGEAEPTTATGSSGNTYTYSEGGGVAGGGGHKQTPYSDRKTTGSSLDIDVK